jgi:peptidyl-tRNA hydrolase, PTH1 family
MLIVGLGNPGKKYEDTYHNMGFKALDLYACKKGITITKNKGNAFIFEGKIENQKIILAKPKTFMNLSGTSVAYLAKSYKIDTKNILIIYDDVDLELGAVRFRASGSAGTHNGMKDIVNSLSTNDIPRIRIGVGKPNNNMELADYVLSHISKTNLQVLEGAFEKTCELIDEFITSGGELENKSSN